VNRWTDADDTPLISERDAAWLEDRSTLFHGILAAISSASMVGLVLALIPS
jgi:hypothetical protein